MAPEHALEIQQTHAGLHPLSSVVDALTRMVQDAEDDFMSLGMNLQKVQMTSSVQQREIAAVMGLFSTDGGTGLAQQISDFVRQNQLDTQRARRTANQLCDGLSAMLDIMNDIDKQSDTLKKAGLFLHVIGINTGIECSRNHHIESMFKVVAKETTTLAEQIHQATDNLNDRSVQARAEQQKTLRAAKKNISELEGVAQSSEKTTRAAADKVSGLIDYSIDMVNSAERMAQKITAEINRVVMGIQFHDNLRQRIEHINEVLLETVSLRESADPAKRCEAYLTLELQKAQLESLVAELEGLFDTQTKALTNILQAVSELSEKLGELSEGQESRFAETDPVRDLLDGLNALQNLNRNCQSLSEEIRAGAGRSEQIVNTMHDAIQTTFSLANDVKLNALNAIIKAAKFGHAGEALQVLAQGMVSISKDTRQLMGMFKQLLDKLHTLSRQSAINTGEHSATEQDKGGLSVQLQEVFNTFRQDLQASRRVFMNLADSLTAERQALEFMIRLKETIAHYTDQIGSYAASIRPDSEVLLVHRQQGVGSHLEERYTMKEERAIHQRMSQIASADVSSHDKPDDDDQMRSGPSISDEKGGLADVDLWDSPEEMNNLPELPGHVAPQDNSDDEDFGANIELF